MEAQSSQGVDCPENEQNNVTPDAQVEPVVEEDDQQQ